MLTFLQKKELKIFLESITNKEKKVPQARLSTDDGYTIYSGDIYWYVNQGFTIGNEKANDTTVRFNLTHYFVNEANAKSYIFHHKPIFSLDEIITDTTEEGINLSTNNMDKFKRIAQRKLKS